MSLDSQPRGERLICKPNIFLPGTGQHHREEIYFFAFAMRSSHIVFVFTKIYLRLFSVTVTSGKSVWCSFSQSCICAVDVPGNSFSFLIVKSSEGASFLFIFAVWSLTASYYS